MGRGIIQLFAQAGHQTHFYDTETSAVSQAHQSVIARIDNNLTKNRISEEQAEDIKERLIPCHNLTDLSRCDIVIEAVVEDITVKRNVFTMLESVVGKQAILASNTSSLLVADIAAACTHPERVAGLHFFNPVPLIKIAEVIPAVRTAPYVIEALKAVVTAAGHLAVTAQDQPGFLINHAGRGFYTEGLRILEDEIADAADVDRLMREAAGFRMGPFELLDLTGLDVSGKVMESIYTQFHQEQRFRPSTLIPPRISAGLLGRKSNQGWYQYQDGQQIVPPIQTLTPADTHIRVWIDSQADQYDELVTLFKSAGAEIVDTTEADCLLIVQPWGIDASQACADARLDATRCVAIDPLPGLDKHRTLMLTPLTLPEFRNKAWTLLTCDGGSVTVINDSPGFVVQRVLATIVNIAANIAQRRIANVQDIEQAVMVGLNYPHGPLSWGDNTGGDKILRILEGMLKVTGDPRYRPCLWLRRRVQLGISLTTEETSRR